MSLEHSVQLGKITEYLKGRGEKAEIPPDLLEPLAERLAVLLGPDKWHELTRDIGRFEKNLPGLAETKLENGSLLTEALAGLAGSQCFMDLVLEEFLRQTTVEGEPNWGGWEKDCHFAVSRTLIPFRDGFVAGLRLKNGISRARAKSAATDELLGMLIGECLANSKKGLLPWATPAVIELANRRFENGQKVSSSPEVIGDLGLRNFRFVQEAP